MDLGIASGCVVQRLSKAPRLGFRASHRITLLIASAWLTTELARAQIVEKIELMEQSTVRILVLAYMANGDVLDVSSGSGFVLPNDYVVTNDHVVGTREAVIASFVPHVRSDKPSLTDEEAAQLLDAAIERIVYAAVLGPDQIVEGSLLWRSNGKDLAVLTMGRPLGRPAVTLSTERNVRKTQTVYAMGFPGAADRAIGTFGEVKITRGIVSAFVIDESGRRLYQIDAPINAGNSGGPLFTECGEVIGINVEKSLAGEGVGWSIRVDELIPTLRRLGIPIRLAEAPCDPGSAESASLAAEMDSRTAQVEARTAEMQQRLEETQARAENAEREIAQTKDALARAIARMDSVDSRLEEVQTRSGRRDPLTLGAAAGAFLLGGVALILVCTKRGRVIVKDAASRSRQLATRLVSRQEPGRHRDRAAPASGVLFGLTGPFANEAFRLEGSGIVIGRDPQVAQLVFPAEATKVSKRHATIRFDRSKNMFFLQDFESKNGTYVEDGERLVPGKERPLETGVQFYVGDPGYKFQVRLE